MLWRLSSVLIVLVACGDSGSTDDPGGGSDGGSSNDGGSTSSTPQGGNPEPGSLAGITQTHNLVRANVDPAAASPLPPLQWSTELAAVAQAYADQCIFDHSGGPYGENLFASSGMSTPVDVVTKWAAEVSDYDYATNSCTAVCGHYTQIVWAASTSLGCGVTNCTENSPFGGGAWQNWVCNYDPPGNFIGQQPY